MAWRFSGLWKHPDFMKFWIAQTVSTFGSRISRTTIPLIAVIALSATPDEMGILVMASSLPVLIFGLFIGAWTDRLRRRPLMIAADLARMGLILLIPLAFLTGGLTMPLLYVLVAALSILSLVFDVAYQAMLPSLVEREHLLEGNSKLATTDSLAEIGGPAITGLLIQWVTAPFAVLFDAFSFAVSAFTIGLIRKPEAAPVSRHKREPILREIIAGGYAISSSPLLRILVGTLLIRSFFGSFYGVLYDLYAIRELGLTPALLGFVVATGGIGALVGTFLAQRLPTRLGLGRALGASLLVGSLANFLIPLAGGSVIFAAGLLIMAQIVNDAAMQIYLINEMSLRQSVVPDHLLGRVNASIGFFEQGVAPVGALVAGVVAGASSPRTALFMACFGGAAALIFLLASPVYRLRDYAEAVGTTG